MDKQPELKGKISFGTLDLSAYLVQSLVQGLALEGLPVNLNPKADTTRPQVMNVEL
jgi:hypothetical protein